MDVIGILCPLGRNKSIPPTNFNLQNAAVQQLKLKVKKRKKKAAKKLELCNKGGSFAPAITSKFI